MTQPFAILTKMDSKHLPHEVWGEETWASTQPRKSPPTPAAVLER